MTLPHADRLDFGPQRTSSREPALQAYLHGGHHHVGVHGDQQQVGGASGHDVERAQVRAEIRRAPHAVPVDPALVGGQQRHDRRHVVPDCLTQNHVGPTAD